MRYIDSKKPSEAARHTKCAPFACTGELKLSVEPNPLSAVPGTVLVAQRCTGCGRVLDVRGVVPEPELVDDEGDCA